MTSNILSKAFAVAIAGFGFMSAPVAYAGSMVPTTEGEVEINVVEDGGFVGCLDNNLCLNDLSSYGIASIKSLTNNTTGTSSRLFVDSIGTYNEYSDSNANPFNDNVKFKAVDVGTNPSPFVFRPSTDEESGQLEVGTFEITFTSAINDLLIDFFDVERVNSTAILGVNGSLLGTPDYIEKGPNNSIASRVYNNVTSIILQLGKDENRRTGDGVSFTLKSVPEPGMIVGLSMVAGAMFLKRRKEAQA